MIVVVTFWVILVIVGYLFHLRRAFLLLFCGFVIVRCAFVQLVSAVVVAAVEGGAVALEALL